MSTRTEHMNEIIGRLEPVMLENFEHLHRNPELSFKEFKTTQFIKDILTGLGIEIQDIGMETGVVGLLKGRTDGPCIGLRADIDGLPVNELTSCPYKSRIENVMHACGHDTHMGSLLGAARILSEMRDEICGSVKFLFQPAEEKNLGAKLMIEHGALKNPDVDMMFGMHNQPEIPAGQVGVKNGALMAAVNSYYINVYGKGGHGGVPHRNLDPVAASAAIINALQTIVSRRVEPRKACVISLCSIHAGNGLICNVTPSEVNMAGTVRWYDEELGSSIEDMMRNVITNTAAAYGCTAELLYNYDQTSVTNPADVYPIAVESVKAVCTSLGRAEPMDPIPSTGGEDFTFFMQEVPSFFYWLGVGNKELECVHPWHSPHFRADERAIPVGAGVYASSVFHAIDAIEKA